MQKKSRNHGFQILLTPNLCDESIPLTPFVRLDTSYKKKIFLEIHKTFSACREVYIMKILQSVTWITLFLWLLCSPPALAQPVSSPEANREALKSLLEDLRNKIDEADKRMIAHPRFIEELRSLVEQYKAKLREVFLFEDFSDGNYTKNPEWSVRAGQFQITSAYRLRSRVRITPPAQGSSSEEEEKPLEILLRELLKSTDKKRQDEPSAPAARQAVIRTLARIGPAFEMDLSFVSESTWGAMELVLLGGSPLVPRYRLIYKSAPSRERPIEIVRVRGSRSYIIESATQYPALDDGSPHRIQWMRDATGHMRVLVDGKEILSTVELFYRDDFKGFALVNRGGTYEWGPIKILQAEKATQP